MRVYLSGPMTGLPDLNKPAFMQAEGLIKVLFPYAEIINPASINPHEARPDQSEQDFWIACMRNDIRSLADCDTIVMLPGHKQSKGATLELTIARALGMEVLTIGKIKA